MSNGTVTPSELSIDSSTGIFTIENQASIKATYEVDIIVTTTDGINDQVITVPGIVINKVCGANSATLTPPTDTSVKQIPNYENLLQDTGAFVSSNENCPVISNVLDSGSAYFYLYDYGADYAVRMKNDANSIEAVHEYTVTAYAEGGASATVTGYMELKSVCSATEVSDYQTAYSFDIPASDSSTESFPDASTSYITLSTEDASFLPAGVSCYQTFSYASQSTANNVAGALW